MNDVMTNIALSDSFYSFVFRRRSNRLYLLMGVASVVGQLLFFKWLMPYPDFMFDSYSYIEAAQSGQNANLWPVGYSKFLGLVHLFTHSHTLLVVCQYVLVQAAAGWLFFTVTYFFPLIRAVTNGLFLFLLLNPMAFYLANYVSSDALFLAISLHWFTLLLWIIHKPVRGQVWGYGVLIVAAFTVRYYAAFYPLVGGLAWWWSRYGRWTKAMAVAWPVAVLVVFAGYTRRQNEELTGVRQFSLASGRQSLNNALYMYPHIRVDTGAVPGSCKELARHIDEFYRLQPGAYTDINPHRDGAWFIMLEESPVLTHLRSRADAYGARKQPGLSPAQYAVASWAVTSPLYKIYGDYLTRTHPVAFVRYYIVSNCFAYVNPNLEILAMGSSSIGPPGYHWFDLNGPREVNGVGWLNIPVRPVAEKLRLIAAFSCSLLFGLSQLLLLVASVYYIRARGWNVYGRLQSRMVWLCWALLGAAFLFQVIVAPVLLRYQAFVYVVTVVCCAVLLKFLYAERTA